MTRPLPVTAQRVLQCRSFLKKRGFPPAVVDRLPLEDSFETALQSLLDLHRVPPAAYREATGRLREGS